MTPIKSKRFVDEQTMRDRTEPTHRIYMQFVLRDGWQVSFLEADLATSLAAAVTFTDPERIRELARQGKALETSEARALFEYSIGKGRGGIHLDLTSEQYALLKTSVRTR
ncbi:MAG: hypothetical protein QOJ51_3982 [Acidobacteriaceae bacterium]|nr:hypothetical protein [Acidobacteriaceae bacterium]